MLVFNEEGVFVEKRLGDQREIESTLHILIVTYGFCSFE